MSSAPSPGGRAAPSAAAGSASQPERPLLAAPPRPRWRIAAGAAVVLVLIGLAGAVVAGLLAPRGGAVAVPAPSGAPSSLPAADERLVVVHVLGAVPRPGLYRLPEGSRIVDAVAAAGGFAPEAERGALNLARVLVDAEQLVVPAVGEAPVAAPPGTSPDGRIDLNRADRAELETLPRVGPAMAERIVAWREQHGGFRAVEDLLEVSGIGERTLEAMRELVTV